MKDFLPRITLKQEEIFKDYLTTRSAPTGSIIMEMGNADRDLLLLFSGICEVYQCFQLGKQRFAVRVGMMKPPFMIGEASLLFSSPRSASIIVAQDAVYYKLSHTDYEKMREEHPDIAVQLLEQMAIQVTTRFLSMQAKVMDRIMKEASTPSLVMKNMERFFGHIMPCNKELSAKLFGIKDED